MNQVCSKESAENTQNFAPEGALKKFLMYFSGMRRLALISGLIAGILTHLTLIILMPVCADPVLTLDWYKPGTWELYSQGRWAWDLLTFLRGYFVDPVLSVMVGILFMALTAVLIVDLFNIKEKVLTVILSVSMVVSPVLANHLFYYGAAGGIPTWFLSTLPIYIIYRSTRKPVYRIVEATLFTVISLAMSQQDISTSTGLIILMLILDLLRYGVSKDVWSRFLQNVLVCALGSLLYYFIWKIFIVTKHVTNFYGGADSYGIVNTITNFPTSLGKVYSNFWGYFFNDAITNNSYWYRECWNAILLIATLLCIVIITFRAIQEKKILLRQVLFIIIFISLIPAAFMSVTFLVTKYNFYLMMADAFVFVIPFICAIYELLDAGILQNTLKWIIIACAGLIIWTNILSDNAGYLLLNQTSTQTKQVASRVLSRIESDKEYKSSMPVCFIGSLTDESYHLPSKLYEMSPGSTFGQVGVWPGVWETSNGWGLYIYHFCGVKLNYYSNGDDKKIETLANSSQFKNMDYYPSQSSIRVIDGVMVVKFGDFTSSLPNQ